MSRTCRCAEILAAPTRTVGVGGGVGVCEMRDAQDAGCARCGMRKSRTCRFAEILADAGAWACARCGGVRVCKMRDSLPPRSQLFHRSYSNKLIINIHTGMARCGGVGVCKMRAQLFHRSYSNKLIINIHTGMARCGGVGVCKMRGRARVQDAGLSPPPLTAFS